MPAETMPCPFCAETIPATSGACGFCGRALRGPAGSPRSALGRRGYVLIGLCAAILIGVVASVWLARSSPATTPALPPMPNAATAWADCLPFVQAQLAHPATAKFPSRDEPGMTVVRDEAGRWTVNGYMQAENQAGVLLRQSFSCTLVYAGAQAQLAELAINGTTLVRR